MSTAAKVISILTESLSLGSAAQSLTADAPLLGAIPEFDSMAVLAVITRLEEVFGIRIADDEISADTFESVASLTAFVEQKLS